MQIKHNDERNTMKKLFSERYGYTKPSDVIIREQITLALQNAICSCYDQLPMTFYRAFHGNHSLDACKQEYCKLERYVWKYFFNQRENNYNKYDTIITKYFEGKADWYLKLDLLDISIEYLRKNFSTVTDQFINSLNAEFERLHFAYRIINDDIVEIDSKEEIETIENALNNASMTIRMHLSRALELYAQRPEGDYRNSIKESISAVEVYCREKTGENTLGKALNKLEQSGLVIPAVLKQAFDKLYAYTNQPDSGIRHALMDDSGAYTPQAEEALFMLVSCSAFINYLVKKGK